MNGIRVSGDYKPINAYNYKKFYQNLQLKTLIWITNRGSKSFFNVIKFTYFCGYLKYITFLTRNLFPDNMVQMMFVQYESKLVPKYKKIDRNKSFSISFANQTHLLKNFTMPTTLSNHSITNFSSNGGKHIFFIVRLE